MRKLKNAAHVYMVLGLVSGIFYREFTKYMHFTGKTPMSLVHGHLLTLGMVGFLLVLALDKQFQLSGMKQFPYFFWFYNAGIAITVGMMEVRGISTVIGHEAPEGLSWVAGGGHLLLLVGLIQFFTLLGKRLDESSAPPKA